MAYIAKKFIALACALFLVSALTFCAFAVIPGDAALMSLGTQASDGQIARALERSEKGRPLARRYARWLMDFLRGDLGVSLKYKKPVASLLPGRVAVTALIGAMAAMAAVALGVPLGTLAASEKNSAVGKSLDFFSTLCMSIPEFFLSVIFIWIFGIVLHVFSPGKFVDLKTSAAGFFKSIFFPVCAIAIPQAAVLAKFTRAAVIREQSKGYVNTAKSKGCPPSRILFRHILRNALVSLLPLMGMIAANVFAGSVIVEQAFGIPGVGRLLVSAIASRDFPLAQAITLWCALVIAAVNFAVDIAAQILDPGLSIAR